MLKITDYNKIKITSIRHRGGVVHFRYEGSHYFVINGGTELTSCVRLLLRHDRKNCERISSNFGLMINLIKYKSHKNTLKDIDKENFVIELKKAGLVEYDGDI